MDGRKEELCVVSIQVVIKDIDEMRVLSGVVYMTKSRGPRTEPCGTPQRQVCREERLLFDTKTARGQIGPKPV